MPIYALHIILFSIIFCRCFMQAQTESDILRNSHFQILSSFINSTSTISRTITYNAPATIFEESPIVLKSLLFFVSALSYELILVIRPMLGGFYKQDLHHAL